MGQTSNQQVWNSILFTNLTVLNDYCSLCKSYQEDLMDLFLECDKLGHRLCQNSPVKTDCLYSKLQCYSWKIGRWIGLVQSSRRY